MKKKLLAFVVISISLTTTVSCGKINKVEEIEQDSQEAITESGIPETIDINGESVSADELLSGRYNNVKELTVSAEEDFEYGKDKVYAFTIYDGTITVNDSNMDLSGTYNSVISEYGYSNEYSEKVVIDYSSDTLSFDNDSGDIKVLEISDADTYKSFGIDKSRFTIEDFSSNDEYIFIMGSYTLTDKPNTIYDVYLSRLLSMECPYAGDMNSTTAFMTLRYDINTKEILGVGIDPDIFDAGFSAYDYEEDEEYAWMKTLSTSFRFK